MQSPRLIVVSQASNDNGFVVRSFIFERKDNGRSIFDFQDSGPWRLPQGGTR